jgi:hypothetical protein
MDNLEEVFLFAVEKLVNLQPNAAAVRAESLAKEFRNKTKASASSHPTTGGVDKTKDPGRFSGFANGAE